MKKVSAFFLAIMLCAACVMQVFAETKEILFRDIPWESDYATTIESLREDFKWEECYEKEVRGVKEWLYPISYYSKKIDFTLVFDENEYCEYAAYCPSDFKVAGVHAERIVLRFAYVPDENKTLTQDKANTALVCAQYDFNFANSNDLASFLAKIKDVYGNPKTSDISPDGAYGCVEYKGDNNTALSIIVDSYGLYNVSLIYASLGGNKLLETAKNSYLMGGDTNTDGL